MGDRCLRTKRLVLRSLSETDLDDIIRIASDYRVSKWLIPVPHPYTRNDGREFLKLDQSGELGTNWAIESSGRFIGVVGVGPGLGYWSDPLIWRQGYMTEAAQAAVSDYFYQTDADEIRSGYFQGNAGSQGVLTKLGFEATGTQLAYSRARKSSIAMNMMILTRARWTQNLDQD